MCKRYPTLNTLGAETAMPLLGWLTRELDMGLGDMRNVRKRARLGGRVILGMSRGAGWVGGGTGGGGACLSL